MKRLLYIIAVLIVAACDNGYLESDNVEELVVEGWIESGHAPVVLVSSTLPVSSTPRPLSDISRHILRYAEVTIEHNGSLEYLTARLTDRFTIGNYFTSATLRGVPGETYRLHVKWLDFEASAECTIPQPTAIDSILFEKSVDDTSYTAKIIFRNNPDEGKYYQTFRRIGDGSNAYQAVSYTSLDGSLTDTVVVEKIEKPLRTQNTHFHPGDTLAVKLATIERHMYEFWKEYANQIISGGGVLSAPINVKGNVTGAIGYWAGYGIDVREIVCR